MIGLRGATVRFGSRTVLRDLDMHVEAGRALAVLGPNGCGKTTALRAMLGLVPLAAGSRMAPPVVGYVPQSSAPRHRLEALDIVVMGRSARIGLFGQPGAADLSFGRAALAEVGIEALARQRFDRLSGGQRQLVLLARALATGSPALVLDEPCSALDLGNQRRLLMLLDGLRKERQRTIVFTTHEPNHALAAADEALLMMPDGEAVSGPVEAVLTADNLGRLFGVEMRLVGIAGESGRPRLAVLPAFVGTARAA